MENSTSTDKFLELVKTMVEEAGPPKWKTSEYSEVTDGEWYAYLRCMASHVFWNDPKTGYSKEVQLNKIAKLGVILAYWFRSTLESDRKEVNPIQEHYRYTDWLDSSRYAGATGPGSNLEIQEVSFKNWLISKEKKV